MAYSILQLYFFMIIAAIKIITALKIFFLNQMMLLQNKSNCNN